MEPSKKVQYSTDMEMEMESWIQYIPAKNTVILLYNHLFSYLAGQM